MDRESESGLFQLAPAKLNLFLEIVGRRPDGFHDLNSVFQEIDLADGLRAWPAEKGQTLLSCDLPGIPLGEENLVVKAVNALRQATDRRDGIRFFLEKRIPAGGGLGGGSSDAAAALKLADRLWNLRLSATELAEIGSRVGSDVPFFIYGGAAWCTGRGEKITPLAPNGHLPYFVVMPNWGVSTVKAYQALAGKRLGTRPIEAFLQAFAAGEPEAIARESYNRFEEVLGQLEPRQPQLLERLRAIGWPVARLSGSGSAVWCLADRGFGEALEKKTRVGITAGFWPVNAAG